MDLLETLMAAQQKGGAGGAGGPRWHYSNRRQRRQADGTGVDRQQAGSIR